MKQNQPIIIALVVVGLMIVGYLAYTYLDSSEPEPAIETLAIPTPSPPPPPPTPEPVPVETPAPPAPETMVVTPPETEPKTTFILPRLDASDELTRDAVSSLSSNPRIAAWLTPDELIRKLVVFVDNLAAGSMQREHAAPLAPEGPFLADQVSEKGFVLDAASYDRYNEAVEAFASIDSKRAAEFYVLVRPLMQEAYDELGYPDRKFDDVVFQAIGRLLETPIITEPIKLIRPVVMYEFEDPKLEKLSSAQKQMIRMGPQNTRAVQAKLSELALELRTVLEK